MQLMKYFRHTFLENCKGYKVETWSTHGQLVDVLSISESGPRAHNLALIPIYSIHDNRFSMKFFCYRFLRNYERVDRGRG